MQRPEAERWTEEILRQNDVELTKPKPHTTVVDRSSKTWWAEA